MQDDLAPLIVVSGFPRTGTSTMMRMLYQGGIEVIAEEHLKSGLNEFDPYGNFELEGKNLAEFTERTPESTSGKAVKIVSPLIPEVYPIDRSTKVLFMTRDPNEIVASMLAMRVLWEWTPQDATKYAREFFDYHEIPVKYIKYTDMLSYPRTTAFTVESWLERKLDIKEMVSVVDRKARTRVKGDGGQKRLVTYHVDRALVDDQYEVSMKEESSI